MAARQKKNDWFVMSHSFRFFCKEELSQVGQLFLLRKKD